MDHGSALPPHVWNIVDASNSTTMQDGGMDEVGVVHFAPKSTPPHAVLNVMKPP